MKKLVILLVIVLIGIFAGSPYYTAYKLKQAYDNQDGVAIANAIDYPQLIANVDNQLTTRFANTLEKYPLVAKLGGSSLTEAGDKFISDAIVGAIDKDNIETIIRTHGQSNKDTKKLLAAWAIASDTVNLNSLVQDLIAQRGNMEAVLKNQIKIMDNQQPEKGSESGTASNKPSLKYCGVNCFNISGQIKGYPITLQFARDGLIDWKVVNVELP